MYVPTESRHLSVQREIRPSVDPDSNDQCRALPQKLHRSLRRSEREDASSAVLSLRIEIGRVRRFTRRISPFWEKRERRKALARVENHLSAARFSCRRIEYSLRPEDLYLLPRWGSPRAAPTDPDFRQWAKVQLVFTLAKLPWRFGSPNGR